MRKFLHLVASCLKRSKMKTRTVHNVHITDLKLKVYLLCTSWLIYKGTVSHFYETIGNFLVNTALEWQFTIAGPLLDWQQVFS